MKAKSIYQGIALLAVALTTAACQNEINEDTNKPKPSEKVEMTIRATQGMAPQTRTIYNDLLGEGTDGNIEVKWEGGTAQGAPVENIKLFDYATNDDTGKFTLAGTLSSTPSSISDGGHSIDFTGEVTPADNYIAVYPAENCTLNEYGFVYTSFLGQEQDCSSGKELAHLKKYDIMLGKPAATGTGNYTFEHKAIMLRFDLTLPNEESVNNVTLATSIEDGIATGGYITSIKEFAELLMPYTISQEISLGITNHTASTALKAYMMIPGINLSEEDATLTITVATASGKTYEGKLATTAGTELKPGLCYTLKPTTLTLSNTITMPPVAEGKLGEQLGNIPLTTQTELALAGAVNATDITALATFLKDPKAQQITKLDLSRLTYPSGAYGTPEVSGLAACTKVVEVILPNNAQAIGDAAFAGCTSLTTVTQNDIAPSATTRASMPKRVKTVGANAFKGCTSMTEMYLHSDITKVGNNAFEGCTSLTALVFEGTKTVGSGITLGTDIVTGSDNVVILLPLIKDPAVATTYKDALGKDTYYYFNDFYPSTDADNLNKENYTLLSNNPGATSPSLPGGVELGDN